MSLSKKTLLIAMPILVCVAGLYLIKNKTVSNSPETMVLFDFEDGFNDANVIAQDADFEWIRTDSISYLKVYSGYTIKEPGVVLKSAKTTPWDLTGKYAIKADVTNLDNEAIQVEMFVGNDPDGLKRWYCSDYVDLKPGQTRTITVPLAWSDWIHSPQLDAKGMRGVPGQLKTDIPKIQEITLNTRYSYKRNVFAIDNIRAEGILEVRDTIGFLPFVDEFGMYEHNNWPGKIHTVEELRLAISNFEVS